MLRRLFTERNEPLFRSAKVMELGPIAAADFGAFIAERFAATGREVTPAGIDRLLEITAGQPYDTQELARFLWAISAERPATPEMVDEAFAHAVMAESARCATIWEGLSPYQRLVLLAVAAEAGRIYSEEYRHRHRLGPPARVQKAVEALAERDLVEGAARPGYTVPDPFLRAWLSGPGADTARAGIVRVMAQPERAPEPRPEPERSTISGIPYESLYSPANTPVDYDADLGDPGRFPYTRGIYETMYRGRAWTMRQFAGFGTAEETNRRFRYLLDHGQTGLSTAFDMPTLMGYDSDHARSLGEVGREGVAVDTLADMEDLFAGIPLDRVTTSMTVNAPAAVVLAQYVVVAEKQGIPPEVLGGTIQADILKEYIAQKEWIFPPEPSMRLMVDMIEWCTRDHAALASGLDLGLPHPRGRARPRRRSWRSRWPTGSRTSRRAGSGGWTSTTSRRGCRSSSTPTSTSSRRSRSTAPRAGSGPASCATATGRRASARC